MELGKLVCSCLVQKNLTQLRRINKYYKHRVMFFSSKNLLCAFRVIGVKRVFTIGVKR